MQRVLYALSSLRPVGIALYLNATPFPTTTTCLHQLCTDMSEEAEDIKPKLSLVINYEGTRQYSPRAIPTRSSC